MAKSGMSESDVESEDEKKTETDTETTNGTEEASVAVISKPVKTSTPNSIVIQSLIKNLCDFYVSDVPKSKMLYNLICEKLHEMAIIDESFSMNEFEGMRNQYQRAFHYLITSAKTDGHVLLRPVWPNNDITNEWSHYYREFDEVSYIAGGGFGQVFRVKHKLDGTDYAVKKIFIRSEGIKSVQSYLSEVKTFASLNHSNIVQYKAAWLELNAATSKDAIMDKEFDLDDYTYASGDSEEDSVCSVEHKAEHIDSYIYPDPIVDIEVTNKDSDSFQVSFERSRHISYSNTRRKQQRSKRKSISEGGNAICTIEEIRRLQSKPHPKWATLYIQMSLCQSTLKQWLETRNTAEIKNTGDAALVPVINQRRENSVMEILKQLLKGLKYIHSKQIVHHDIKPSNIFMEIENGSLIVQLGDFGLACPLQNTRHTLAFGTKLYAAPEQLSGKCDSKSDMYSLGIVLLELTETFQTDMERVQSITELRKGVMSPGLIAQYPQLSQIIAQLILRYPVERPTASALLEKISVNVADDTVVRSLKDQIAEKDEEIIKLKALLKTAGVETV